MSPKNSPILPTKKTQILQKKTQIFPKKTAQSSWGLVWEDLGGGFNFIRMGGGGVFGKKKFFFLVCTKQVAMAKTTGHPCNHHCGGMQGPVHLHVCQQNHYFWCV